MKILVTGSGGFIGSHLVTELQEAGHKVVGADRSVRTRPIRQHPGDLQEPGVATDIIQEEQPDIVVHLAAQVGRLFGEQDLVHTLRSNAQMTMLVARATAEVDARLVYCSTSEIYGDQKHAMCDEIDGPFTVPHNLYGLTKRWGEEVSKLYAPEDLTIVRPSMPYGPGVPPGQGRAALPNILWQAVTGQRIPIHKGSERSWCWIGDAVRGFRLIIEKGKGGTFNLGRDDNPITMVEVAMRACEMVGASATLIDLIDPPPAQTVVKRLATYRLRDLGWKPEVELEEGMKRVLEWVRKFDADGHFIP